MNAKTTASCVFCGRRATTEAEIVPVLKHHPKGKEQIKRLAIRAPVCTRCAKTVERNRGWQQRQQATREAEQQALEELTDAARLFDPDTLDRRSRTRRDRRALTQAQRGR